MKEIRINEGIRISLGGFTVNPEAVAKHVNDINPEHLEALIASNELFTIAEEWNKEDGYNVEAAQKCWDFVRGEETKKQEPAGDRLADGVYLIDTKGNAVAFAGDDTCAVNDTAYIGIVQGSHSVAIALQDVSKDEITLTSKKDDGEGRYIDSYMDAVQDWNGQQNTEHLQAAGLNPAIQLQDGEYIPTLAELYLICLNRRAINAAMRFVGGQELAGWYWSSTEYSATGEWDLYLYDGGANDIAKATGTARVRPVSAFLHR